MPETQIFQLPLLAENQAGRVDLIHNEAIQWLELLSNASVATRSLSLPPTNPVASFYIPAATATGAWVGQEEKLAFYLDSVWNFFTPPIGFRIYLASEDIDLRWNGTIWDTIVISGDMTKTIYDSDNDGIVDEAAIANGLNSSASSFHLDRANHTGTQDVSSLEVTGNSKYVGTDSSGNKGVYDFPSFASPETGETIKGKLEALSGNDRLDASAIKNLPAGTGGSIAVQDEGTTVAATATQFNFTGDVTATASGNNVTIDISAETGLSIVSKMEGLTETDRLDVTAIDNFPQGNTGIELQDEGTSVISFCSALNFVGGAVKVTFGSGAWTPVDIQNQILFWLSADSAIPVNDRSNNNRIPLNTASRPSIVANALNGKPIFRFSSTNGLAYSNAFNPEQASVIAVTRSNGGMRLLYASNNNNGNAQRFVFDYNTAQRSILDNGSRRVLTGSAPSSNVWHMLEFSNSLEKLFNNANEITSTPTTPSSSNPNSLSACNIVLNFGYYFSNSFNTASLGTQNEIAELIVFNKNLPTTDVEKIQGYLAHKYGLGSNLPTNHPYKTASALSITPRAVITVGEQLEAVKTANFTAEPNKIYRVNSTGGAITAQIADSSNWVVGDKVWFVDEGGSSAATGFGANALTIAANSGQTIVGNPNLVVNTGLRTVVLQFSDNGRFNLLQG